tara:strand:+ start:22 stop:288 length:267 start_codon:yes stop_codon:yes gene_type:complete
MAQTFIAKGTSITTNPSASTIGGAQFVRITATSSAQTVTVFQPASVGNDSIGIAYLHAAGDTIIIEKAPLDRITCSAAKAHPVGSPRS